jgi:hypothetical protein
MRMRGWNGCYQVLVFARRPAQKGRRTRGVAPQRDLDQRGCGSAGIRAGGAALIPFFAAHTHTQVLEKLAAKYPMAVVTGRPKSDCDFALEHFGIKHLFKVRSPFALLACLGSHASI